MIFAKAILALGAANAVSLNERMEGRVGQSCKDPLDNSYAAEITVIEV